MNTTKPAHRLTALALSFLMVLTMTPVTASAQGVGNDGTAGEIIAFEALPEETANRQVPLGTSLEDLNLPDTLNATVRVATAEDTGEKTNLEASEEPVQDSGEPVQPEEPAAKEEPAVGEDEAQNATSPEETVSGNEGGEVKSDGSDTLIQTTTGPAIVLDESGTEETDSESEEQQESAYMEMTVFVPVTWDCEPAYDGNTAGIYTFTAEIEGFTLRAELPQIIVTVGTPAGVVTAFDALADDLRWQSVEYGTAWEDLNLPTSLAATVEGEAAEVPVTWESDPVYDADTKGLYLLTAKLAEGFSATAELPHITVVVRARQMRMLMRSVGGGAQDTDPFLIGTAAQLAEIAALTNAGQLETMFLGTEDGTVYLKLDNDIDLSGIDPKDDGTGWVPIGENYNRSFKGSFDGGGHTIANLTINRPDSNYQGLFGYIGSSGAVKNLGVTDVNISGNNDIGGVAGDVDGGTVQNCYSTGAVSGMLNVGGVAGFLVRHATVQNCTSTGLASGRDIVGGIVGYIQNSTVQNCISTGLVSGIDTVGGVVGMVGRNGTVKNCAALNPSVTATMQNIRRVAGNADSVSTLSDNIAFGGMTVTVNGTSKIIYDSATGMDGATTTAADIKADNFFQTMFESDDAWTYEAGRLPILKGISGQGATMPAHIIDITGTYFNGAGTEGSPYEISTPQQLAKLAELVNAGDTDYNSKYYILTSDLDLSAYGKNYNDGQGWAPIGTSTLSPFRGNFDGNYRIITGLYINRADIYQGLFGAVYGTVKNLGVVEVDISGRGICGGITGCILGTVENCFVTGKIQGLLNDIGDIGGIAGDVANYAIAKNCYSSAEIRSNYDRVGGIAGQVFSYANVENCYSTGSVSGKGQGRIGGIAGVTNGTVRNCAALNPSVAGTDPVGRVGVTGSSGNGVLENNIAFDGMTVTVGGNPKEPLAEGGDKVDGLGKTAENLYTDAGNALSSLFASAGGWTYTAGSLPILTGFAEGVQDASMPNHLLPEGAAPFAGAGTESSPYLIKTAQDLARLAELVNAGNDFYGKHLRLENNLDLSGYRSDGGWVPIGKDGTNPFRGSFDGNGHTIANLTINRPGEDRQGLFGFVGNGGIIQNLGVVNIDISGASSVGGVAGYVSGTVETCYSTGRVEGSSYAAGGVAGFVSSGTVRNCYSTGRVEGSSSVGGVAGNVQVQGTVETCYSTGSVSGEENVVGGVAGSVYNSTVQNCAALNPKVSGSSNVGRVAGVSGSSTLQNNYAYSGISGTWNNKGLNAKDGEDLTSATLFGKNGSFWTTAANWDSGIWSFEDGKLPILKDTDSNVMPGQSGAPGLYLLNLSTDKLSISLAGTDVSVNGTSYTALASYGAHTVTVTVTGMEEWTEPGINVTWKKGADAPADIPMDNGGSGTFDIPAEFSGDITVTAASVSNPTNKTSVTLAVSKRNLKAADFTGVVSSKVYNGSAQELTYTPPNGAGTVTLMYNGNSTVPTDAGTYAVTADVTAGTVYNEATGISLGNFTITPKPVSIIGIQTSGGFYSGSTYVGVAAEGLYGLEARDVGKVGLWTNVGTTADANAGENKLVTVGTCTISGERAFNYTLIQPTGVTVTIKPRPLTINSATVENKEYDGTTTATVTDVTFATLVTGESLELGTDYTATAVFSDANPGTNKTVKVTITSKDTNKAKNYSLPGTTNTTATITPKAITGTVSINVAQGSGDADRIDEGDTLTANSSGITPDGATLSYQWYRGGTAIDGATGNSYTIAARTTDPAGSLITVKVTGTGNYMGEKISGSVEIGKIPLGGSISITGGATVDDTLTLDKTSLTPSDATTATVWLRQGTPISGATGNSYVLTKADLGKTLSVRVTGTGEYSGTLTDQVDVPPIEPEAPASLTASAGNGQLTLNWTAPFDGGSAITKYQYTTDDGANWTDIGVVTTYTVTGLTNGTAYTFKLRAVNNMGEGADASVTATPVQPSSGGGGGSSVIVTPPAPEQPNAPTQGEVQVPGRADSSGNLTATITEQSITAAIDQALAQARQNGAEQNGISLVLNVGTGSNQPINSLSFNLPKAVQDTLIAKGVASVTFAVGNQNNTMLHISLDFAALKEISRQANGNVNLTATRINSGKLTGEAKKAISSRPVFDLKASYGSGKQIQSFGAGSVSVTIPYPLGANENAGNIQAVYVDTNGRVQWLISSVYDRINGVLRFSTNHFSTYGVGYRQDAPSFTDISTHWAKDDIAFVANRGLFSGTSETTFSPNTAMTRGMFVTALGRLANADVSGYKKSSFTDVKSDAYYMGYIEWANQNGIVNGIGNGRFAPDQSITREQMAVMMSNYAKVIGFALPKVHAENTFADSAKISAYAKEAVKQMQMAGVISGKNSNLFDPQGTATRAEVSAVLRRFVELAISSDTAQGWTMNDSGKWMYFKDGKPVTGKNNIDGSAYTFDQYGVTADVPKNLRYTTYTVQKGDSFWLIAHKLGCTMSELERLNNKSRFDLIHPGDVLRVPEK